MTAPRFFTPTSSSSPASSLPYIFDPSQVSTDGSTTGVWRAYATTDIASVSVSGLSVSVGSVAVTGTYNVAVTGGQIMTIVTGSVSSTTDLTPLVNAQTTGNAYLLTANRLLSGVSGALTSNLTDPAWITGQVASTVTGWNSGIVATVQPIGRSVTSNSTPTGIAPYSGSFVLTGQAIAANPTRAIFFVQNIHTGTPLYVNLGASAVSSTNYSFILNPSAALGYGGGSFSDDHYKGAIYWSGSAGIAWEL